MHDRKQELNVLSQVNDIFGRPENKDSSPGPKWLRHILNFPLQPLIRIWGNFTGSKNSSYSFRFVCFGPIGKQNWPLQPLIDWDKFYLSWSSGQNWWNIIGSKNSMSSTEFVFFWSIGKHIWPSWPLLGWDILKFIFSDTAEWNRWNFTGSKYTTSSSKFMFSETIGKSYWPSTKVKYGN